MEAFCAYNCTMPLCRHHLFLPAVCAPLSTQIVALVESAQLSKAPIQACHVPPRLQPGQLPPACCLIAPVQRYGLFMHPT